MAVGPLRCCAHGFRRAIWRAIPKAVRRGTDLALGSSAQSFVNIFLGLKAEDFQEAEATWTVRASQAPQPAASTHGGECSPGRVSHMSAIKYYNRSVAKGSGLIHHSDRGSQYLSIRYTERLADAGIDTSVGSVGDSYALAEASSGCSRLRSSTSWARGNLPARSNGRPCNGSAGITATVCTAARPTARSATSPPKKQRRHSMKAQN